MSPLPSQESAGHYFEELYESSKGYELAPFLRAQSTGRVESTTNELFAGTHGVYNQSFDLPSSTALHLPSYLGYGLETLLLDLDRLSPRTQPGIESRKDILAVLGITMKIYSFAATVSHTESGSSIDLEIPYADTIYGPSEDILGALMLLDPSAWEIAKKSGLVLLRTTGSWPRRRTSLDKIALPDSEGKLHLLDHEKTVTYERNQQWQQIGAPAVVYQG